MRVVDGALIQVDEEGNEILKTPMKEKKTERTCSVAERKMWDDLSTSVFSVFETVLDSDSVTKDFKDKDGGLEVLTSTLNHLNHALQDKSSISWWTHLIQVRKVLKPFRTERKCWLQSASSHHELAAEAEEGGVAGQGSGVATLEPLRARLKSRQEGGQEEEGVAVQGCVNPGECRGCCRGC